MLRDSWVAKRLAASQEGHSSLGVLDVSLQNSVPKSEPSKELGVPADKLQRGFTCGNSECAASANRNTHSPQPALCDLQIQAHSCRSEGR
jgi:hypothetical protein